jgi:hypothetical protein
VRSWRAPPLLECAFLIPLRRDATLSDGKLHQPRCWEWLEAELWAFGGGSYDNAMVSGWYEDPDTQQRVWDDSWRYTVALSRRRLRRLRNLLAEACNVFEQKCIYLSVAGHVEFVRRSSHEEH